MKTLPKRILCLFGIHDWYDPFTPYSKSIEKCRRCGASRSIILD